MQNHPVPKRTTEKAQPGEGHRARLRRRYERAGFAAFAEHEVLELILTLCIPRRDVKNAARNLLERFGNLRGVLDAPADGLAEIPGIGKITPVALHIIRDTAALYLQQEVEERDVFNSAGKIGDFLRLRFRGERVECLEILHLDAGRRIIRGGIERIENGTVDQVNLIPRKIVESALKFGSRAIVVAHNHPGGTARFSTADIESTWALKAAAATVDIEVTDHMLVADDKLLSMRSEGLLEREQGQFRLVAERRQALYGSRVREPQDYGID